MRRGGDRRDENTGSAWRAAQALGVTVVPRDSQKNRAVGGKRAARKAGRRSRAGPVKGLDRGRACAHPPGHPTDSPDKSEHQHAAPDVGPGVDPDHEQFGPGRLLRRCVGQGHQVRRGRCDHQFPVVPFQVGRGLGVGERTEKEAGREAGLVADNVDLSRVFQGEQAGGNELGRGKDERRNADDRHPAERGQGPADGRRCAAEQGHEQGVKDEVVDVAAVQVHGQQQTAGHRGLPVALEKKRHEPWQDRRSQDELGQAAGRVQGHR